MVKFKTALPAAPLKKGSRLSLPWDFGSEHLKDSGGIFVLRSSATSFLNRSKVSCIPPQSSACLHLWAAFITLQALLWVSASRKLSHHPAPLPPRLLVSSFLFAIMFISVSLHPRLSSGFEETMRIVQLIQLVLVIRVRARTVAFGFAILT